MKKLRILQVGKYYPPARGGMESVLELLCQGIKNEVDLQVVVANETNVEMKEDRDGVPVHRLAQQLKLASAPICLGLWKTMKLAQADIVHIHLPNPLALLTYYWGGISGRLVCSYHSDIIKQRILGSIVEPLQESALRKSVAIIISSPHLINSSSVLSRNREKCVVVPFGVSESCFESTDQDAVKDLKLQYSRPIILSVGRLVYYKGFEVLIRAFSMLKEPATLLIVGEGPLRSKLQRLIEELALTERVFLMGKVADTAPYFEACDIFVLASVAKTESFGVVQLEAMARGKPVINSNLDTGVPFVSRHQETGLTVPVGNEKALAGSMDFLLRDCGLRAIYGRQGKERVLSEFTAEKMVNQTLELYKKVSLKRL